MGPMQYVGIWPCSGRRRAESDQHQDTNGQSCLRSELVRWIGRACVEGRAVACCQDGCSKRARLMPSAGHATVFRVGRSSISRGQERSNSRNRAAADAATKAAALVPRRGGGCGQLQAQARYKSKPPGHGDDRRLQRPRAPRTAVARHVTYSCGVYSLRMEAERGRRGASSPRGVPSCHDMALGGCSSEGCGCGCRVGAQRVGGARSRE